MSPAEVLWRTHDQALRLAWRSRRVSRDQVAGLAYDSPGQRQHFTAVLPPQAAAGVPATAREAVLAAADQLLTGEWEVLGFIRTDLEQPDWFYDPATDRRTTADRYCFDINFRSEQHTGNVKQLWELSRLQHLTLLSTAWFLSHDGIYARRAAEQLRSWCLENPFLSGVHWTSGIEVGIRLISLTWIRRLLDDWPEIGSYFENNALVVRQIHWHQEYLAAFRSRGSSANNHVIAEAAGQLVASCAFPWFPASKRWHEASARLLERELLRNTFPSGIGRELASDYQGFAAEVALFAAVETALSGRPLSDEAWRRLCAMFDSGAALLDEQQRPPRQGDSDEGRAVLLDPPGASRWPSLLSQASALFGRRDWWPPTEPDAASSIIASIPGAIRKLDDGRPADRPWHFVDAGITLLRTKGTRDPEIWCRCDGGPHGYQSIAAHAHADALSVEVRYGGVDILADPGTYCYHGEPEWRSYFRSTLAHNTLEIDGRDQSASGGPFMWVRHANGRTLDVSDIGDAAEWTAMHDGYLALDQPARHRRCVRLDRASRSIDIVDEIDGCSHDLRMAIHLGPEVEATLASSCAMLTWPDAPSPGAARLDLPEPLRWRLHRGETSPILGWYSSGFGRRTAAFTLIGSGRSVPDQPLSTRLEFLDIESATGHSFNHLAVSWCAADVLMLERSATQAEAG
ncbi:MAG: alginate lyase family protein [Streptosporangiaceae bacterium]